MELEASVVQSIRNGKKVTAIKELRQLRGIGLKEAKQIVDQYESENNIQSSPSEKVSGGQPLFLIVVIIALVYVAYTMLGKS